MSVDAKSSQGLLRLVAYDGKLFSLESPLAFAPGQPLVLELQVNSGVTLELKSIGSIKQPDGRYVVRARAATMTRQARDTLQQHFGK